MKSEETPVQSICTGHRKGGEPDVIVITLPGCVNNYNDDFTNFFGLLALDVMKATAAVHAFPVL